MPAPTHIRRLAAAVVAFGLPAAAAADLAPVVRPPADLELVLRAKVALAADPLLKDANLLVSIIDGGAVVGGAVPTAAANDRVAEILAAVPGVRVVKSECWVAAAEDPTKKLVLERLRATDPRPAAQTVTLRPTTTSAPPRLLMDPVGPGITSAAAPHNVYTPPPPPGPPQFPTIPPPRVPAVGDDPNDSVDRVRRADPRYAGLTATQTGGVITVAGWAADDGDAWDLAAAVRKLPGVSRVVVGRIASR